MKSKDEMIVKAEKLSGNDNKLLKITLGQGSIIIGHSLGIEYEEDDKGEDHNVLAFQCPDLGRYLWLKDEQIKDVELACT